MPRDSDPDTPLADPAELAALYLDFWQRNLAILGADCGVSSPDHAVDVIEGWFRASKPTPDHAD